jgi:hypothetical protein
LLQFLNSYSNLLLVAVTILYVWLTQRTLTALKEASLREREARHLEEIKFSVIEPILSWIDGGVAARFTGQTPRLLTVEGGDNDAPREIGSTVDDPFSSRRRLVSPDTPNELSTWTSTDSDRISRFLYEHAKRAHFSTELRQFDAFVGELERLIRHFTSFANDCAGNLPDSELPRLPNSADSNSKSEWTMPWLLVSECIHAFQLGKREPSLEIHTYSDWCNLETSGHQTVAKSRDPEKLAQWCVAGVSEIRARWEASNLPEETNRLLRNADSVRRSLGRLLFTHSLGVDCDLVSGKKHNR